MSDDKTDYDCGSSGWKLKVPEGGLYSVSAHMKVGDTISFHKYAHGTTMETIERPKWYQFWKPVVITKTIYMDYRGEVVNCNDGR